MKKALSIIIALCVLLCTMPAISASASFFSGSTNGFQYELTDVDDVYGVVITGYTGSAEVLDIPDDLFVKKSSWDENHFGYDYYPVLSVSMNVGSSIKEIKLPRTAKQLDITGCYSLEKITIPYGTQLSATQIENFMQQYSSSEIEVVIQDESGEHLTSPGNITLTKEYPTEASGDDFTYEFNDTGITLTDYTGSATDIILPSQINGYTVTKIGNRFLFQNGTVRSVVIPEGVTELEMMAFTACTQLKTLVLPSTLSVVPKLSILRCSNLKEFIVSDDSPYFTTVAGCLLSKDKTEFVRIANSSPIFIATSWGEKTFVMPRQVTAVGDTAFATSDVNFVMMHECPVTSIGEGAFAECHYLSQITLPSSLETIGDDAFFNDNVLEYIIYDGKIEDFRNAPFSQYNEGDEDGNDAFRNANVRCLVQCDTHTPVSSTVTNEPTCGTDGIRTYYCSVCDTYYNEAIPKTENHQYGSGVITKDPTCTETGVTTYTCTVCGNKKVVETAALGHNYVDKKIAPTCTEGGYTKHTCANCGNVYTDTYTNPTGHSPAAAVRENEVAATCTAGGSYDTVVYCANCGDELSRNTTAVAALGHNIVTTAEISATCTEGGSITYSCTRCDYEKTVQTAALGHNYIAEVVAPTCTKKGYTVYACANCGDGYTGSYTNPVGHRPAAAVRENEVAATCTENGSYDSVVRCANCNLEIRRTSVTVEAPGHNYTAIVVEPTAETGGCTTYICEVCGYSYVGDYTDPLGSGSGGQSGEINFEEPDFDALTALLSRVSGYKAEDYSAESYAAFAAVCDKYADFENEIVSQNEVDFAVNEILSAITDLVPYVKLKLISQNGSVTVNADSAGSAIRILKGCDILLAATPDSGYEFKGWYDFETGRLICTDAEYSFSILSNRTVEAKFAKVGSVSLTFESAGGQIVKTIEKTAAEWAKLDSLEALLPDVPFSYGKTNGRWEFDSESTLARLAAGNDCAITPVYDECEAELPDVPNTADEPVLVLEYKLNEQSGVASFLLAAGIPEGCEVEEIGTAFYYKKAEQFDPTDYELVVNSKTLTSKFSSFDDEGVYVTNINGFSSKYNWAVRGYITYRSADGGLKTVYSKQINIINRQQV